MRKIVSLAAIASLSLLVTTGDASAADQIRKSFDLPAELVASIQTTGCSASPGPQVSVQGELTLAGMKAEVVFSGFAGAQTPQEQALVEHVVVPDGAKPAISPQNVVGGLGDNPFMWLQLTDQSGRPLTSEIFLGRCDQGAFSPTIDLAVPATANGVVTATDCESLSATSVSIEGATELAGVHGKLILRSSDVAPRGQRDEAVTELILLPVGTTFESPQQAAVPGVGGNPLIAVQLRHADGEAIGSAIRLGRCVSITQ